MLTAPVVTGPGTLRKPSDNSAVVLNCRLIAATADSWKSRRMPSFAKPMYDRGRPPASVNGWRGNDTHSWPPDS
jgi:hypothetical protein